LNRSDDLVGTYTALGMSVLTRSQGIAHVPSWAGHMIFKTAYDMVMYAMLIGESKPRTIIELGSGAGGSAVWMADVAHAHGLRPRIVSVDLNPIDVVDSRIEFRQGDLREVSRVIPAADLREFEHPWLVIEDAHVNISQVLDHLDSGIAPGDYLVVEDSYRKRAHLRSFIESSRNSYMLDLKYLDMFGENSVCSMDSLFVAVDGPNRSPLAASNE
jgi:cephalosporin hydroxylase